MTFFNHSSDVPVLDIETAENILKNVFDACNVSENTVPLSTLESYSEYKREKFSFQKILLVVILALFLAVPFCFISPSFSADIVSDENDRFPQFKLVVDGWFPIKGVTATIDGRGVAVYETGSRNYFVEATSSGLLEFKVLYINGQYGTKQFKISGIDGDAPYLISSERVGDYLCLLVKDDGFGIDYSSVHAITDSGEVVDPVAYSSKLGEIAFPIGDEAMTIYISDISENTLQLVTSLS